MIDATDLRILRALRLLRAAAATVATVPLDDIAAQLGLPPPETEARTALLAHAGYLVREQRPSSPARYRLSVCGEVYVNFGTAVSTASRRGS